MLSILIPQENKADNNQQIPVMPKEQENDFNTKEKGDKIYFKEMTKPFAAAIRKKGNKSGETRIEKTIGIAELRIPKRKAMKITTI